MTRRMVSWLMALSMLASYGHAAGRFGKKTELHWKKLDAGIAQASKANKKILLDVYTDWCKWCKKLDAEVYSNEDVAQYLGKRYILVKINAEGRDSVIFKGRVMSEATLARVLGVSNYPTIIFLDSKGEQIDRLGGFADAQHFLPIIKFIGEDSYKKMNWEEYQKKMGIKNNSTE